MSSPGLSSSQIPETIDNDTPGSTPPAPASRTTTPAADVEMTDAKEEHDEHITTSQHIQSDTSSQVSAPEAHLEKSKHVEGEEEEEDASLSLPVSKIKKIFKMDPDYLAASQTAVYATGVATELFIQYFVEQASLSAKVDRRKKILYKDFSNVVSSQDALHFLSDTVPKTQPIGHLLEQRQVNLNKEDQQKFEKVDTNQIISESSHNDEIQEIDVEMEVDEIDQNKAKSTKKSPVLAKGQQTLNFGGYQKDPKPIKKAVIHDLVTANDDEENTEG